MKLQIFLYLLYATITEMQCWILVLQQTFAPLRMGTSNVRNQISAGSRPVPSALDALWDCALLDFSPVGSLSWRFWVLHGPPV